jgi:ComF family protein
MAANIVYPQRCYVCGEDIESYSTEYLCPEHKRMIHLIQDSYCGVCGKKIFSKSDGEMKCYNCRQTERSFDRGYSVSVYEESIKTMIHAYKYKQKKYLRHTLGTMMYDGIVRNVNYMDIKYIVPVPLHWRRYYARKFNQACELIKYTSKKLHIPILKRNLRRVRYTVPQVDLMPDERQENIKGAFKVIYPEQIKGKDIMLIDDVMTTGSTANECARVLKKAGCGQITVVVLAQAG